MLAKGKKVYIEGRLQTSSWEGNDGAKRNRTEIVADNFIPLSPKDSSGFDTEAAVSPDNAEVKKNGKNKTETTPTDEINLDDIPF
jgi:single-strand DNA-binding protein